MAQWLVRRRRRVRREGFASPLNCRYSSFCSVFPDVDWVFGSVGSFFDDACFRPRTGSFEANPPFVAELMQAMARRVDELRGAIHKLENLQSNPKLYIGC